MAMAPKVCFRNISISGECARTIHFKPNSRQTKLETLAVEPSQINRMHRENCCPGHFTLSSLPHQFPFAFTIREAAWRSLTLCHCSSQKWWHEARVLPLNGSQTPILRVPMLLAPYSNTEGRQCCFSNSAPSFTWIIWAPKHLCFC